MRHTPLDTFSGHAIICGLGRVGGHVVADLEDGGITCVLIDSDPDKVAQRRALGLPVVEGDATDEEVLISAGVDRARYLVAAAPSDAVNLFITMSAHRLNPDLVIVSRANDESSESKLVRVGATHVVHIYRMTALTMTGMLLASSDAEQPSSGKETPTETSPRPAAMPGEKMTLEELDDDDAPT